MILINRSLKASTELITANEGIKRHGRACHDVGVTQTGDDVKIDSRSESVIDKC